MKFFEFKISDLNYLNAEIVQFFDSISSTIDENEDLILKRKLNLKKRQKSILEDNHLNSDEINLELLYDIEPSLDALEQLSQYLRGSFFLLCFSYYEGKIISIDRLLKKSNCPLRLKRTGIQVIKSKNAKYHGKKIENNRFINNWKFIEDQWTIRCLIAHNDFIIKGNIIDSIIFQQGLKYVETAEGKKVIFTSSEYVIKFVDNLKHFFENIIREVNDFYIE